jgi:hypothetical protein
MWPGKEGSPKRVLIKNETVATEKLLLFEKNGFFLE